jgi:hypothetical protein
MRFEPGFPGRAGIDLTVRPNRNYSLEKTIKILRRRVGMGVMEGGAYTLLRRQLSN